MCTAPPWPRPLCTLAAQHTVTLGCSPDVESVRRGAAALPSCADAGGFGNHRRNTRQRNLVLTISFCRCRRRTCQLNGHGRRRGGDRHREGGRGHDGVDLRFAREEESSGSWVSANTLGAFVAICCCCCDAVGVALHWHDWYCHSGLLKGLGGAMRMRRRACQRRDDGRF